MKLDMGTLDRRLRLLLIAPALVVAGILAGPGGVIPIVLYVLAGVMVATSLAGSCPLYTQFGLRTCPASTRGTRTGSAKASAYSLLMGDVLDVDGLAVEAPGLMCYARTIVRDHALAADLARRR